MGFSDGRFSIWTGKRAKGSMPPESPHASRPRRLRQSQHHRERRFHHPQEALGFGYEDYDVIPPAIHSASTAVRQPASESLETEIESALTSEIEKVQRTSVNGLQICAMVLFLLVAVLSCQNVFIWYCLILVLLYQFLRRW